jgi:nucleoid DNA-binding protein
MKVTKKSIISEISSEIGLSEKLITKIIDAFILKLKEYLKKGIAVRLINFGEFRVVEASQTRAYNYKERKVMDIPKRLMPKFYFNQKFINEIRKKQA